MKSDRLQKIQEALSHHKMIAKKILDGTQDNYDGADAARCIHSLCSYCEELLMETRIDNGKYINN